MYGYDSCSNMTVVRVIPGLNVNRPQPCCCYCTMVLGSEWKDMRSLSRFLVIFQQHEHCHSTSPRICSSSSVGGCWVMAAVSVCSATMDGGASCIIIMTPHHKGWSNIWHKLLPRPLCLVTSVVVVVLIMMKLYGYDPCSK
jgi:hypothetical protein